MRSRADATCLGWWPPQVNMGATTPRSLLPTPGLQAAPRPPSSRGRGLWGPVPKPRAAGRKPYPALTEDLSRVMLGAHAAAQLLPAHADLELQRGRVPEGAAPLGHRRGPKG